MRIGLKNQSGSLFLMITAQPAPESGNCCFPVSPCQPLLLHPTTLLSSASISPPLPRPSVSSSFSFDRFSVSFSSRGAPPRPNFSLPICLSWLYNRTVGAQERGRGEGARTRTHTDINTADVYKRQTVPGRR